MAYSNDLMFHSYVHEWPQRRLRLWIIQIFGCLFSLTIPAIGFPDSACLDGFPEPFTGALLIDSKYDQNDETRSTLTEEVNQTSEQVKEALYSFRRAIVNQADRILEHPEAQNVEELDCLITMLDAWALPEAMTTSESTHTGAAVRKWVVAATSMALYKLTLKLPSFELSEQQKHWFRKLADQIITDYPKFAQGQYSRMNNHDYWAAWAVVGTNMLLSEKANYVDWGYAIFAQALIAAEHDSDLEYAWLSREVERGHLGLDYSNFALMPLVLMAVFGEENGYPLDESQATTLERLARFVAQGAIDISAIEHLFPDEQTPIRADKLTWLHPWLNSQGEILPDTLMAQAFRLYESDIGTYGPLGGDFEELFPVVFSSKPGVVGNVKIMFAE